MLTVNRGDLNAIREKLRAVGAKAGRATVRQAARRAMAPVRAQVKRDAPYDAEGDDVHIKSEVAMTSKWRGDTLTVKVGIRGGGGRTLKRRSTSACTSWGRSTYPHGPS